MDLTGPYPKLQDSDSIYAVKTYSELLAAAIIAASHSSTVNGTFLTGNSGTAPVATRFGRLVSVTGRWTRASGGNLFSLPAGYRPSQDVFVPIYIAGNVVMAQINMAGTVSTPFSTATGDTMFHVTYATPPAVFP